MFVLCAKNGAGANKAHNLCEGGRLCKVQQTCSMTLLLGNMSRGSSRIRLHHAASICQKRGGRDWGGRGHRCAQQQRHSGNPRSQGPKGPDSPERDKTSPAPEQQNDINNINHENTEDDRGRDETALPGLKAVCVSFLPGTLRSLPRPKEAVQKSHRNPAVEMGLKWPVPTPWSICQPRTLQAAPPHHIPPTAIQIGPMSPPQSPWKTPCCEPPPPPRQTPPPPSQ